MHNTSVFCIDWVVRKKCDLKKVIHATMQEELIRVQMLKSWPHHRKAMTNVSNSINF